MGRLGELTFEGFFFFLFVWLFFCIIYTTYTNESTFQSTLRRKHYKQWIMFVIKISDTVCDISVCWTSSNLVIQSKVFPHCCTISSVSISYIMMRKMCFLYVKTLAPPKQPFIQKLDFLLTVVFFGTGPENFKGSPWGNEKSSWSKC